MLKLDSEHIKFIEDALNKIKHGELCITFIIQDSKVVRMKRAYEESMKTEGNKP